VLIAQCNRAQIQVVGVETFRWFADCALDLGLAQLGLNRTDDPARYLVL
jgi:hypothetical protein